MKVAVIGSRSITDFDLEGVIPANATEIISGGAKGVDSLARAYADTHGIPCLVILPDYPQYGRAAPLRRNAEIIRAADLIIAIWDGESKGTAFVIDECARTGRPCTVIRP